MLMATATAAKTIYSGSSGDKSNQKVQGNAGSTSTRQLKATRTMVQKGEHQQRNHTQPHPQFLVLLNMPSWVKGLKSLYVYFFQNTS